MRLVAAAAAIMWAGPAAAQTFLYEPSPPVGSAFVRFVNAAPFDVVVTPGFGPVETLRAAADGRVGAYRVAEDVAGRRLAFDVTQGGQVVHATIEAAAGSFVTVLIEPQGASVQAVAVIDQTEFNQLRARLNFVNASACASASLALMPAGQKVFDGVARNTGRSRSVNPVAGRLQAGCSEGAAPEFALSGLEAGGQYSIWLMGAADRLEAFVSRDVTAPVRPQAAR